MALCIAFLGYSVLNIQQETSHTFSGITTSQTASSDTLTTLRTNVNSALTNIENYIDSFSTTTANVFTSTNDLSAGTATFGTIAGTIINSGTLKLGTNGSTITELKASTCNLSGADVSIAATSTGYVYCSLTGVASGDVVMAQLSTSTIGALNVNQNWMITSAVASTTAGIIDIRLYNGTGADAVPSVTRVGSSTNVWYLDN